jgi:kexin
LVSWPSCGGLFFFVSPVLYREWHADRHLVTLRGEDGVGTWSVIVRDTVTNEHVGTLVDWHLKLWGESIDADKAVLLPMPDETDDDDHSLTATTTATASTHKAPVPTHPTTTSTATEVTNGPARPTKVKPSAGSGTAEAAASATTSAPAAEESGSSTSFMGRVRATPMWIWGAAGLIGVFGVTIGVYIWRARRAARAADVARDSYEFELLNEDAEKNGGAGAGGDGRRRPRGGELYDAFADGSDDDDIEAELLSDEESETESRRGSFVR